MTIVFFCLAHACKCRSRTADKNTKSKAFDVVVQKIGITPKLQNKANQCLFKFCGDNLKKIKFK